MKFKLKYDGDGFSHDDKKVICGRSDLWKSVLPNRDCELEITDGNDIEVISYQPISKIGIIKVKGRRVAVVKAVFEAICKVGRSVSVTVR